MRPQGPRDQLDNSTAVVWRTIEALGLRISNLLQIFRIYGDSGAMVQDRLQLKQWGWEEKEEVEEEEEEKEEDKDTEAE